MQLFILWSGNVSIFAWTSWIPITVSAFYRLADTLDWLYHFFSLSLCLSLPGAEGQQKALHVSAFCGTYPGRLCHKSCLHLGGSAGPQRVPTPWPADGASQCHPAQVKQSGPQPHAASAGRRWEEGEILHLNTYVLNYSSWFKGVIGWPFSTSWYDSLGS